MLKLNTIYHGDCLEVMKRIDDNSIDLVCTDIPFFKVIKNDWDNQWENEVEYLKWVKLIIEEYNRVLKDNSNIFLFTGRQYSGKISLLLGEYFNENRIIIWSRKRGFNNTRGNALASGYEPICFYSKGKGVFNNIKLKINSKRKEYTEGTLKDGITLSDVWTDIAALPHNSMEKIDHPTQKPIKLIERIITIGSNEDDLILDNTAGSCTMAVAANNLNRNWICIEKEEKYCEIGRKRLGF